MNSPELNDQDKRDAPAETDLTEFSLCAQCLGIVAARNSSVVDDSEVSLVTPATPARRPLEASEIFAPIFAVKRFSAAQLPAAEHSATAGTWKRVAMPGGATVRLRDSQDR